MSFKSVVLLKKLLPPILVDGMRRIKNVLIKKPPVWEYIPQGWWCVSMDHRVKGWNVPDIFLRIKKRGNVDDKEMYRTLNMGIGMVAVVSREDACKSKDILRAHGVNSYFIGEVTKGNREVVIKR